MKTKKLIDGSLPATLEKHLKFIADTFMNNPNHRLDPETRSRLKEATVCMEKSLDFLSNMDCILDEVRLRLSHS